MSQVTLLAADIPLPQCHSKSQALSVAALDYYRSAVELLGLPLKPFRYELELADTPAGAQALRDYLRSHCPPGTLIQLWNLWVGEVNVRPFRLAGSLDALDGDTLLQLRERDQTCLTITV